MLLTSKTHTCWYGPVVAEAVEVRERATTDEPRKPTSVRSRSERVREAERKRRTAYTWAVGGTLISALLIVLFVLGHVQ